MIGKGPLPLCGDTGALQTESGEYELEYKIKEDQTGMEKHIRLGFYVSLETPQCLILTWSESQ